MQRFMAHKYNPRPPFLSPSVSLRFPQQQRNFANRTQIPNVVMLYVILFLSAQAGNSHISFSQNSGKNVQHFQLSSSALGFKRQCIEIHKKSLNLHLIRNLFYFIFLRWLPLPGVKGQQKFWDVCIVKLVACI